MILFLIHELYVLGLLLDLTVDARILRENVSHEEFLGQGECLNFTRAWWDYVDKFCL